MVHVMILAADRLGLLRRICGVYESRRYNVCTLTCGPADRPGFLRINLAVEEPADRARKLASQLARLIDVVSVEVVEATRAVVRELALVKVVLSSATSRPDVLNVAQVFRARVVDVARTSVVLELTGDAAKIDAFIGLMQDFGPVEVVRTGQAAIGRGERTLAETAVAPAATPRVATADGLDRDGRGRAGRDDGAASASRETPRVAASGQRAALAPTAGVPAG